MEHKRDESNASTTAEREMTGSERSWRYPQKMAFAAACFLSLFQILLTVVANPKTEDIDSLDKVELRKQDFLANTDAIPSLQHMSNFTLDNGNIFSEAWVSLYWARKLHMGQIPVCLWLAIAPFQLGSSAAFRTKYPQIHHALGYTFFATSASICIGIILLIFSGKLFGRPYWLVLLINITKVSHLIISLVLALRYARQRKIQLHQNWIIRHVTVGYTVSYQRVLLLIVGPILHSYGMLQAAEIQDRQIWYGVTGILSFLPIMMVESYLCLKQSKSNILIKKKVS